MTDLPTVSMDESGHSGENLLDEVQPVFALASICLEPGDERELLSRIEAQESELKFSELRTTPEGREVVLAILRSELLDSTVARVTLCHKPYMVVAKMVDLLVEPAFHDRGMNFYADDGALKWPISLYELAPRVLSPALWGELKEEFVAILRRPESQSRDRFCELLEEGGRAGSSDPRLDLMFQAMREQAPLQLAHEQKTIDQLDPALATLSEQLMAWTERLGRYEVEHDEADVVERNRDSIMRLADPELEAGEWVAGDRTVRYPLGVAAIRSVDSREHVQVQIADILAGATVFHQASFARASPDPGFANELDRAGVLRFLDHVVAPPEFIRRSTAQL